MKRVLQDDMQLKNHSQLMLLSYIRNNVRATKASLAKRTGLTYMAVKKNLEELLELGFIREGGYEDSSVGRRSAVYRLNEAYAFSVGVHINMFETRAAVLDLQGGIRSLARLDMRELDATSMAFVPELMKLIRRAVDESGAARERLAGICVGAPGPVNPDTGMILTPPNMPQLSYLPLKRMLEDEFGLPACLRKDTSIMVLGEHWSGAAKGFDDVVYIDADIGIGSGIVFGGNLFQGSGAAAGELGHMTLDVNGPLCNCGGRGCLEALSSGISIVKRARELAAPEGDLTIRDVLRAAEDNDPLALTLLNESAGYVGVAAGNAVNLLDPQIVVVGGVLARGYPPYVDIVRRTACARLIGADRSCRFAPALLEDRSGVVGAGVVAADQFLCEALKSALRERRDRNS